ncbi:MAG: hypothetical protein AABO58_16905 [Acidobacteriota bacterium]
MGLFSRLFGGGKEGDGPMGGEMAANPKRPVVLVHGYSDVGKSFVPWAEVLKKRGFTIETINIVTYKSLTNEVTVKDLAEGFDRALRKKGITGDFDAIVHSTGMLVLRSWLTANRDDLSRRNRLRHLIGFAPATWGSPLAAQGRGWLGSVFKGNKSTDIENAPDFLEAGDLILDALELASRFTWDLAHRDLFGKDEDGKPIIFYGPSDTTPYPFIFCGNVAYGGFRKLVNKPGTDGTVRWAGVSLDSLKFSVDLTKEEGNEKRVVPAIPHGVTAPVVFVDDRNHGTIMSQPEAGMADLVVQALNVATKADFDKWLDDAAKYTKGNKPKDDWQHFVIHMIDERGDPIRDYHVELFNVKDGKADALPFDLDLWAYQADKSFRSYHVDLTQLREEVTGALWMRVTLSSGTFLVAYNGESNKGFPPEEELKKLPGESDPEFELRRDSRPTEIHLNLSPFMQEDSPYQLFFPFTTTLVEITIDREPLPIGEFVARVCKFEDLAALGLT